MDYETFLGAVQNSAQLPSQEDALTVTRITLETVSERIEPGGASNLAAQLPEEIGRFLTDIDTVESFTWDQFVDRIVEKGGYTREADEGNAVHHARIVMDIVDEVVSPGTIADLREQFPDGSDWDELFVLVDQAEPPVDEEQRPN